MSVAEQFKDLSGRFIVENVSSRSDYFTLIKEIVQHRNSEGDSWQPYLEHVYSLVMKEVKSNSTNPVNEINFGTSGWRGVLGKDINVRTVETVTTAIVQMYKKLDSQRDLAPLLGVSSFSEAKAKGCVLGFDNRFAGPLLAAKVASVLQKAGFSVHYAGESTTGVLSAAVLQLQAAFSVNLTPSHNPLEYGGYKFNAADAGPAASPVTDTITDNARKLVREGFIQQVASGCSEDVVSIKGSVQSFDSLESWKTLVAAGHSAHGLALDRLTSTLQQCDDLVIAVDCVHGASRLHISQLLFDQINLVMLRDNEDVTFGGVAPEPSSENMAQVVHVLQKRSEKFKIGAIIDPDGDRIRFTDGNREISMNQFGAMAYHFLHEHKGKVGLVAKTVATSNLANSVAHALGEKVFEPAVGFKNFKPVIGQALVCFEESDGISVIGHTPEKDAYIGLLLALDMVLTTGKNLGEYLHHIEQTYGLFFPDRDGVEVSVQGEALLSTLGNLEKYKPGVSIKVGEAACVIKEVITIDGRKMLFEDGSWLMVRPSGTEPKVRFYVESRTKEGTKQLVEVARDMLSGIGLL